MTTKPKTQIMSHDDTVMSPITKASNVLFEDGKTAQDKLEDNVEKSFTPSVENSSSMFKVGQGDNVDYSGNVVDGAYVSCVLKGRTLVNCIQEPSSQDVILPYDFTEGQYVTINDTKESGALGVELKGQTLVNLKPNKPLGGWANSTYDTSSGICTLNGLNAGIKFDMGLLKTSTEYLVVFDILELPTFAIENDNPIKLTLGNSNYDYVNIHKSEFKIGVLKKVVTTPNNFIESIALGNRGEFATPMKLRFMIIEYQQGMENWDIPYFEGMTSVKAPTVTTCQQLFDYSLVKRPFVPEGGNLLFTNDGRIIRADYRVNRDLAQLTEITIPQGNYTISFEARGNLSSVSNMDTINVSKLGLAFVGDSNTGWSGNAPRVEVKYIDLSQTEFTKVSRSFTFDESKKVTIFYHGWNDKPVGWCEFKNIRITPQGKTSSLTLPEEVILRSLPNGVCDTYNTRTGEYVRRIGEIMLDDTLFYEHAWDGERDTETDYIAGVKVVNHLWNKHNDLGGHHFICNKLRTRGITSFNGYGYFLFYVNKSILGNEVTRAKIREYILSLNAIVQYELETPIITKLSLQSILKSWNTTTHIYSEIPENSLYPILSRSNPTYPVILKPSTKYSIVANSYSNGHTNAAINFNLGGATASTTVGNRVTMVTTPSTLSNELLTMSGKGNKLNNVMVIEGDVVGDEPYFEGICDVKSPVVKNAGKNLFNLPLMQKQSYVKEFSEHSITVNNGLRNISKLFELEHKANEQYTIVYDREAISGKGVSLFAFRYTDGTLSYAHPIAINTSLPNKTIDRIELTFSDAGVSKLSNICLVKDEVSNLTYEPYKSNTTTFNQKDGKIIVLRSLPNGVRDTLNVETGEYVQRIGETTFNGNENWTLLRDNENENIVFSCVGFNGYVNVSGGEPSILCDKIIPKKPWFSICSQTSSNGITLMDSRKGCRIGLVRSEGVTNAGEFRAWLSQNPITIQYELATPVVSTVDVQGFPYAYKDGHVQLSSGYNGQSLTPKIEYSLPINRNCQIRMNQAMVERHQKHIDELQAMIITNMVNTQYRQSLTKINYQLGGE